MMKRSLLALSIFLSAISSVCAQPKTIDQLSVGGPLEGNELIPLFQSANPALTTTPNAIGNFISQSTPLGAFANDPATTTGLTYGYYSGYLTVYHGPLGGTIFVPAGTVSLPNNSTSYVELDANGVVSVSTAVVPGAYLMAVVTTVSGAISSITDVRPKAEFPNSDFISQPVYFTGLTYAYNGALLNTVNGPLSVTSGSITLPNNQTNFIEVAANGAVSSNTSSFTPGRYPIAIVVTSGGSITGVTDQRPLSSVLSSTSLTLTDGTHIVNGVQQITVTGGTVGGSTPNATLTIAGGGGSDAFANNSGTTTGLTYGFFGGVTTIYNGLFGGSSSTPSNGTVALTDNTNNFVQLDTSTGTVISNTQSVFPGMYPMAFVTTSGGAITAITDIRPAVQLPTADFSPTPELFSGLTYAYNAGFLNTPSGPIDVTAGTIALTDNSGNFVEVDHTGTVLTNTNNFTPGNFPMAFVGTTSGVITSVQDWRPTATTVGQIIGFTAALNTASPNASVNVSSLSASGGTTDQDVSIVPKGLGAFQLSIPDGATGGNKRGINAIDIQIGPFGDPTTVASGINAIAIGYSNTVSGANSVAIGLANIAAGNNSYVRGNEGQDHGVFGVDIFAGYTGNGLGAWKQSGHYTLSLSKVGSTPTPLTSDGNAASNYNQVLLPNGANSVGHASYAFTGQCMLMEGFPTAGATAAWSLGGVISQAATAASTVLAPSSGGVTLISEDPVFVGTGVTVTLSADTTNGALQITGTGQGGGNFWTCDVYTTEFSF